MRKPEQRLADRVRRNIGTAVLIERIENSAGFGTPDACVLAARGRVTWTEHKVATAPIRRLGARLQYGHPLTIEQKNWHLRWHQKGGNSIILVGCGELLFAVPGTLAEDVCKYTLDTMCGKFTVNYRELVEIYNRGFKVQNEVENNSR